MNDKLAWLLIIGAVALCVTPKTKEQWLNVLCPMCRFDSRSTGFDVCCGAEVETYERIFVPCKKHAPKRPDHFLIQDRNDGSVYKYKPGDGLVLLIEGTSPSWAGLRISDVDYSVFRNYDPKGVR